MYALFDKSLKIMLNLLITEHRSSEMRQSGSIPTIVN